MITAEMLPDKWRDWEIGELLGSGSYGNVHLLQNGEEKAALKVIRIPASEAEEAALAHEYPDAEDRIRYCENIVKGLQAEIRAMELLRSNGHVVILQDHAVTCSEDRLSWTVWIRMELLTSFPDYLIGNRMKEKDILDMGVQICSALEACEKENILHRDIKPENIMTDGHGTYKLGDFGLARQMGLSSQSLSLKGTFTYMAPEVYHGSTYGPRADQYSLGIVLYRLLNRSRDPFVDPDIRMIYYRDRESALQRRMKGEPLPKPAEASPEASAVICKACAFRPEDRYDSISALRSDLSAVLRGETPAVMLYPAAHELPGDDPSSVPVQTSGDTEGLFQKKKVPRRFAGRRLALAGLAAAAVIALAVWFFLFHAGGASGTCGTSMSWTLDKEGSMTVSGSGTMDNYQLLHPSPWRYLDDPNISSLTVEEGVESIGDYSFYFCTFLEKVSLPESLAYIGSSAFAHCWLLGGIHIPGGVTRIGTSPFIHCVNLTSITVDPDNTVYDSRDNCNALILTASGELIAGCKTTYIPEGIVSIESGAFWGGLPSQLAIPDSVTRIADDAFAYEEDDLPEDFTLLGSSGSCAETYAREHGILFEEL